MLQKTRFQNKNCPKILNILCYIYVTYINKSIPAANMRPSQKRKNSLVVFNTIFCGFVSSLVCDLEDFADGLHCEFKHDALSVVPTDNPVRSALEKRLETFDNPVESFDTEAKRKTYFRKKWGIVQPVEKILGIRYDTRLNKKSGTYDQVPVKDTFVYIPILETIKLLDKKI